MRTLIASLLVFHRAVEHFEGSEMRPTILTVSILCTLAGGCAAHLPEPVQIRLSPEQAVMNAAASPEGISGIFEMPVRSAGRTDGNLYLNSERDYRDPRNLSIVIVPAIEALLIQRLGSNPETYLLGKTTAVKGTAKKTRIVFTAGGRPTDKYYFQTHLRLTRAADLTVSGERPQA